MGFQNIVRRFLVSDWESFESMLAFQCDCAGDATDHNPVRLSNGEWIEASGLLLGEV